MEYKFYWTTNASPIRPQYDGIHVMRKEEGGLIDDNWLKRVAIRSIAKKMSLHPSEVHIVKVDIE